MNGFELHMQKAHPYKDGQIIVCMDVFSKALEAPGAFLAEVEHKSHFPAGFRRSSFGCYELLQAAYWNRVRRASIAYARR